MYWVYENWTAEKKAVIHLSTCGSCNDGGGCHANSRGDRNGRWHGPFETLVDAEGFASSLGERTVRKCSRCVAV